jgi:hypothetical protein
LQVVPVELEKNDSREDGMTRWIAGIIFGFIYETIYMIIGSVPVFLYMFFLFPVIAENTSPDLARGIGLLFFAVFLFSMVLAGIRTKCAVDEYGERDKTLVQAHLDSKYAYRMKLSFLPIIGKFYQEKTKTPNSPPSGTESDH